MKFCTNFSEPSSPTLKTTPGKLNISRKYSKITTINLGYLTQLIRPPLFQIECTQTSLDKIQVLLPYMRGLSERLANVFHKHGVKAYHKPFNSIRSIFVHPKDPTSQDNKCGIIYKIVCSDCDLSYIGETAKSYSTRLKEN